MGYCKVGERATVVYSFSQGLDKKYTTLKTPIEVIIRPTQITGYLPGRAYAAYYYVTSGSIRYLYADYGAASPNRTLIGSPYQYYYPPFGVPTLEWLGNTGFSGCRDQNFRYFVTHHTVNGLKVRSYCNLVGFDIRAGSQRAECPPDFVVSEFKWTLANTPTVKEPLNFELLVINSDGSQFIDYGINSPTFKVTCGDCPENTIRCEQSGYPGYCCLPCSPVAQKINSIAARI